MTHSGTGLSRDNRSHLGELIRQLASGRLTNDEFERRADHGVDDKAFREIYLFAWSFYDDFFEHHLRGEYRLSPFQRSVFARCVVFLRSGLPYEWPKHAKWLWCPQRVKASRQERIPWWKPDESVLAVLPVWGRARRRRGRIERRDQELKRRTIVDDRIWPFRRMADYRSALQHPTYLTGCAAD